MWQQASLRREKNKDNFFIDLKKDVIKNRWVYFMAVPVILFYIIFHYAPMYGIVLAFKDFSPKLGILGSEWVGIKHFEDFFSSYYCWRLIRNTLLISIYSLVWGFPMPIILALLLNEVKNLRYKKMVQTVSYVPHFISLVVVCGMVINFCSSEGLINDILSFFGAERVNYMSDSKYFRTIYILSGIWQNVGWQSIIYIAAISGIDQSLYEAAYVEGAGKFKQAIHITIPALMPTIMILLILSIGGLLSVGFEKIILLYNPLTYETADVISSYVYRKGLIDMNYSYSTAIGLFNSIANFILLIIANTLSRKMTESSLW